MSSVSYHRRPHTVENIYGESLWTQALRKRIVALANFDSSVLITGPSGTGKELIARALHAHSPRGEKPIIPVDCAAVPPSLFGTHMFGHVRGAFTGANHSALGCFRAAQGGTIFLDEIGELNPELQASLLRVLQERSVTPVGSHQSVAIDVRVVAATNRDLQAEVVAGRFREDLFYRLNVVELHSAPLRARIDDIAPIAEQVLAELAVNYGLPQKRLTSDGLEELQAYTWPGNVRQLKNIIERAVINTPDESIDAAALAPLLDRKWEQQAGVISVPVSAPAAQPAPAATPAEEDTDAPWPTLAELEEKHLRATLKETGHNQAQAAKLLDIDRQSLRRKVQKYEIDVSKSRRGRPRKPR